MRQPIFIDSQDSLEQIVSLAVEKALEQSSDEPQAKQPEGRVLTFREVRLQLRCSAPTLRKLIRSGKLPAVRLGMQWRIREQDLKNFMGGSQ